LVELSGSGTSVGLNEIQWNSVEPQWDSMEFSGTWWGSMGLGGTQWNLVGLTISMKKKKYQCTSAKDIKPPS